MLKMRLRKIKLKNLLRLILHATIAKRMNTFHTHAQYEKNPEKYVKQVWMPKKSLKVNNIKANTQGLHVKRVPKKKAQYFVGKNAKKGNTKGSKENISKVYNSRKNTKSLKKKNISQVFYPKRTREVAYKK